MTGDGRGQSLTDYTIMLYDNAFTLMFAMKSFNDCTKGNPSWEAEACCLAKAHVSAIFGLGLGKLAGAGIPCEDFQRWTPPQITGFAVIGVAASGFLPKCS